MIDSILQLAVSNALIAFGLSLIALVVDRRFSQPRLTHLLWVLVIVKLLTPPLFRIPIELPRLIAAETTEFADDGLTNQEVSASPGPSVPEFEPATSGVSVSETLFSWQLFKAVLIWVWLAGTGCVALVSVSRVWRFRRLLQRHSQTASPVLQTACGHLSEQLGISRTPEILTTSARLSPLVWWLGGRVRIVLPDALLAELSQQQWELVLAHELAHVRRGDYIVRWLEWVCCVVFWWNPLTWWAQRNLREIEEACCDEVVLGQLEPGGHAYASAIVEAVESLVRPAFRPPAFVSALNSGGLLERRIQMILSGRSTNRASGIVYGCVCLVAVAIIPVGLVQAQDLDAVRRRLSRAVQHDEITFEQAGIMMNALLEATGSENHFRREVEWWVDERDEHENARGRDARDLERMRAMQEAEREFSRAFREGHMSKEEARDRLVQLKNRLWRDRDRRDDDRWEDDRRDDDDRWEDDRRDDDNRWEDNRRDDNRRDDNRREDDRRDDDRRDDDRRDDDRRDDDRRDDDRRDDDRRDDDRRDDDRRDDDRRDDDRRDDDRRDDDRRDDDRRDDDRREDDSREEERIDREEPNEEHSRNLRRIDPRLRIDRYTELANQRSKALVRERDAQKEDAERSRFNERIRATLYNDEREESKKREADEQSRQTERELFLRERRSRAAEEKVRDRSQIREELEEERREAEFSDIKAGEKNEFVRRLRVPGHRLEGIRLQSEKAVDFKEIPAEIAKNRLRLIERLKSATSELESVDEEEADENRKHKHEAVAEEIVTEQADVEVDE